jgi:type I restriction enzyme S subunit
MLGDLTEPTVDQSGPPSENEFVYVDISSVDNQAKRIVAPKRLAADAAPSRARQRLRTGDVLISMTRPNLNAVAIVPPTLDYAIGSTGFHVLRALENVLPEWLYYGVQSRGFVRAMSDLVQGALYPAVRPKDIRAFELAVPSLEKQRRIVDDIEKQFSRLDEAVANLKRVKANLKRYKAAVLKAAVEGRLVPTEAALARREGRGYESAAKLLRRIDESHRLQGRAKGQSEGDAEPDRAPLPAGWAWANIAQVGQVISGLTKNPKRIALASKLPYLRVANVYANELRLHEIEHIGVGPSELEKLLLRKGDLLIVEGNGSPSQLGRVAMWDGSIDPCVHQNHIIKLRLQLVNPRWVLNWLLSPGGRSEIEQVGSSTSGLHTLSTGKVAQLPVPLPPLAEQDRIISEIDRCLSIVRGVEAEIDSNLKRAQTLRQATLSRAFSPPPVTVVSREGEPSSSQSRFRGQ